MFTPSKMLQNYLNATPRDRYDIIGALMGYINADPTFKTNDFDQAVNYVLRNNVSEDELYEEFDTKLDYEEDSTKWNEEYYSFARVYLKDNFSKKRIEHVKAVARKLYPNVVPITEQKGGNVSTVTGGSQSIGKKNQGKQHRNPKSNLSTMQENRTVSVATLIMGVVFVLLAVMIACIMLFR